MPPRDNVIKLEGVDITFRNFAGKERLPFNADGERNFSVLLPEETAEEFMRRGLNVKRLRPRGEEEFGQAHVKVKVNFKGRPPKLVLVTGRGKTVLPEDMAELMDQVDVEFCDIMLNVYNWRSPTGNSGKSLYLDSIYLVVYEDELAIKYRDVPELGAAPERPALEQGPKALEPAYVEGEVVFDSDDSDEEIPY